MNKFERLLKLIDSAQVWIEIRELRNKIALEYASSDFERIFKQVFLLTSTVLSLREKLK